MKTFKARFDFLHYGIYKVVTLTGVVHIYDSGVMVLDISQGGDHPYYVEGGRNEVQGWEGKCSGSGVQAGWSRTIPAQYHGYWIEAGIRYLFQIETDE